jgi:isoleucyl-tRNA synthetase
MEKYGADAMRFALMASPAVRGEDLRFSEKYVEEVLRRVILPLWNAYSFFVTYANEAAWNPASSKQQAASSKVLAADRWPLTAHPLDAWILAETQDLVNRMTEQLDRYDLSATCSELHETIDCLTDWYIRRSRRRFGGKESAVSTKSQEPNSKNGPVNQQTSKLSPERDTAFATLHHVLLTISKLLAPFCPFLTEEIYLNLHGDEHDSIHLSDWPETRKLTTEELALLKKNRLQRAIVSLGMKLRSSAKIKVRQPLSHADVVLPKGGTLTPEELRIVAEELNVHEVCLVKDALTIAEAFVQVDARKVGPRLGGKVQEIIRAAKEGNFSEKNGSLIILGETLSPEEAHLSYRGKEGHTVASEGGIVVSLDITVTEDLDLEGAARDIVRAVQAFRKEQGLKVSDRVTLEITSELTPILKKFQQLIEGETNGKFEARKKEGLHIHIRVEDEKIAVSASELPKVF